MLYRPSFCSNCGEKIVRAEWHLWTSRRFCDVCVSEQPVAEYGPKAAILLAMVAAAAGATTYFAPKKADESAKVASSRIERPPMSAALVSTPVPTPKVETSVPSAASVPTSKSAVVVEQDQANVCGAETKKGTPCSRRVKGNVRCFQHQGMPAMSAIASQGR
jgi:hypothetical protein